MAKDDYHVIVYQILSYLYTCLKNGEKVKGDKITWDKSEYFTINEDYWRYIIVNMVDQELITGVVLTNSWGQEYPIISDLDNCRITPRGIEFLCDNSFMEKAKKMLKDIKAITPFI